MISDWLRDQTAAFLAMRDQAVVSWHGVEMAVRGGDDEGIPEYDGPDVPCLQLLVLDAVNSEGQAVTITTYQNDMTFGMWVNPGAIGDREDWGCGYRRRTLTELPAGPIREVEVYLDDCVVAEVRFHIGDRELLLIAGELREDWSGRFEWYRLDESVLVFTDPGAAEALQWVPRRGTLRRIG
ncbi:hypothetical protein [Actinoplanes sp. N902-109]|uniref:hypothetical protein n=1 Tax=Actinoplanes sp. (strain N902-109) TaxID=649831 RepID=UPI00059EFE02|nr:hypothetical protein [Actinoplanes sp. N902-109]